MSTAEHSGAPDDPLIDEVRAIRRALSDQFGNDVDRLCDHLQELERAHPERMAEAAPPPISTATARERPSRTARHGTAE